MPPPPPPPGGPAAYPLQQLSRVAGTIQAYTANDREEYDGFTLHNDGGTVAVRFPAHIAGQLMGTAKPGTPIEVQGFYETTPEGLNVLHLVDASAAGQTFYDTPPAPPAAPPVDTSGQFSGTITDIHKDVRGLVNGLMLGSKQLIELPPGIFEQLQDYLKPGTAISGSGIRVNPGPGVVLVRSLERFHPQTLTIGGRTYMVR